MCDSLALNVLSERPQEELLKIKLEGRLINHLIRRSQIVMVVDDTLYYQGRLALLIIMSDMCTKMPFWRQNLKLATKRNQTFESYFINVAQIDFVV